MNAHTQGRINFVIKIGEPAKICNVNIQTLRYYDKIGLLPADYVDGDSGYRFYTPEKIKIYQTILHLKELTFSLEESKEFLHASKERQLELYEEKRIRLQDDISANQSKIQKIDLACIELHNGRGISGSKILQLPFSDDPEVIGKWELCGSLSGKGSFSPNALIAEDDFLLQTLFFLPGGGHVWMYCWTKGILYVYLSDLNISVPNEYRIFTHKGETYLSLNWMVDKCTKPDAEDCTLIYRQVDNRHYTERETFAFRDRVDLPFVPDSRVLGEWNTVDIIRSAEEFDPAHPNMRPPFFVQKISFYDRGLCIKKYPKGGHHYLYTNGLVMDRELEMAESYRIVEKNGKEYLILEHKSGDYLYLGKVFCYYVFEKEKQNETDL